MPTRPARGRIAERGDAATSKAPPPSDFGPDDEMDRPPRMTPPRDMGAPALFDRHGDGALREPVDKTEVSEARMRMERALRSRRIAARDNPFLDEEASVNLPALPQDDPDWSYKWMRTKLPPTSADPGGVDTSNISENLTGRLGWEYFKLGDLPKKFQGLLAQYAKVEGKDTAGSLTYKDVSAVRTSRKMRDLKVAAMDYRADELRASIKSDAEERADRSGYLLKQEDRERRGFIDAGDE